MWPTPCFTGQTGYGSLLHENTTEEKLKFTNWKECKKTKLTKQ